MGYEILTPMNINISASGMRRRVVWYIGTSVSKEYVRLSSG
jgi:hypothetical protein